MTPIALRRLRRRLGLSQAGFARLVGVTSNTVARWERGEVTMQPTTARLIALLTARPDLGQVDAPVRGARQARRPTPRPKRRGGRP